MQPQRCENVQPVNILNLKLSFFFLHIPILLSEYTNLRARESFFDFYEVIITVGTLIKSTQKKKPKKKYLKYFKAPNVEQIVRAVRINNVPREEFECLKQFLTI